MMDAVMNHRTPWVGLVLDADPAIEAVNEVRRPWPDVSRGRICS